MSDALSNLKDHAPTLPSATDVRDAVQSHLPSAEAVRSTASSKRTIALLVGLLAGAAALFGLIRRRRTPQTSAAMYTPPLPES
jgi:hypothetical protein